MDKPADKTLLLAPGADGAVATRLPSTPVFPRLDDHLVQPETREEMVRGRRVIAMPAKPPHGDRHFELDYVLRANIKDGYVGSTDLLTRSATDSDFATDTCIRKDGIDPTTHDRYLEEVAFEVVNTQTLRDVTERAEDLTWRGVRRVFAIFVKKGHVAEWNNSAWQQLDGDATIRDECLVRPVTVKALLRAAEADNAVAQALLDKQNPVLEAAKQHERDEGKLEGKREGLLDGMREGRREGLLDGMREGTQEGILKGKQDALLKVLEARGIEVSEPIRAQILACTDTSKLDGWLFKAAIASSADDVLTPV